MHSTAWYPIWRIGIIGNMQFNRFSMALWLFFTRCLAKKRLKKVHVMNRSWIDLKHEDIVSATASRTRVQADTVFFFISENGCSCMQVFLSDSLSDMLKL